MPRDGSATRQRILDTAERLVIDNGFAATSVDQVIAESGTSKGAFFHYFDSKTALARALVDRYAAANIGHLDRAVAQVTAETDDPVARVIAFLRVFEDGADELMAAQSSCLYVSVLTERQLASSGTWDQISRAVLADHVFVTFEGAFILARSMNDAGHMRAQLRVLRQLLEALLEPRPTPR
jgi:TetR/AcrR family transcriptional repressor of nem operon